MDDRVPTQALLEEWARVDPAFLRWCERQFSGVTSGMIGFPLSLAKLPRAVDALRTLPDGAGGGAVREALTPFWDIPFRAPYEEGV